MLRKKKTELSHVFWISLGLAVGFLWFSLYSVLFYLPAQHLEHKTIRMQAVVVDWPRETKYGISVSVLGGEEQGQRIPMLLSLDTTFSDLKPGDRLSTIAYCTPTSQSHGTKMLGFRSQGIYLFARSYGSVTVTPAEQISPRYYPVFLAHYMRETIHNLYSDDADSLLCALVTGWKSALSEEDQHAFSRTGLSHVVAVSGMHISFLAGALSFLLGRTRKPLVLLQILLIFFFASMTGNGPGALRAAILCSAALLAPLFGRKSDPITSLFGSLLFLLLLNPFSIANAGLQFSFAATLGIDLVGQPLYRSWNKQLPKKTKRVLCIPLSILAVSLGATIFTIPLTALYFGQVSLIAPLANVVTNWAVSLSFLGGILSICAATVYFPLGYILATLTELPISFFLHCAREFAKFPFAAVTVQSIYYLMALVFLYAMILISIYWWQKGTRRFLLPTCSCLFAFCLSALLTNLTLTTKPLVFSALDVGQGQCIALSSGSKRSLIDCGGSRNAGALAANYLHEYGWTSLDLLILTHYHADHCNGVAALMDDFFIGTLVIPDTDKASPARQEIETLAKEHGTRICYLTEKASIPFGSAELTLYPPLSLIGDNEAGLTILCSYGNWDALVTGDMPSTTEHQLLKHYTLPDIELLVLGHHGSRYSTSKELLDRLTPEYALISVGDDNTFGHPATETLDRLKAANVTVYRTDRMGTISVSAGTQEE